VIVDDDVDFLEELKEVLCSGGYSVEAISDPVKAVQAITRLKPDAVLLDLKMDGKDGFEVAHELSQNPATAGVPVIAMSGYYAEEHLEKLKSVSVVRSFLTKPLVISDVMAKLHEVRGCGEPGGGKAA
jgi:CheY-like chemotaxis protein